MVFLSFIFCKSVNRPTYILFHNVSIGFFLSFESLDNLCKFDLGKCRLAKTVASTFPT